LVLALEHDVHTFFAIKPLKKTTVQLRHLAAEAPVSSGGRLINEAYAGLPMQP
jgi:hypothetical protein